MQTQLTHLATISQQRFVSNERDIPLFEEAFDTASLRKFFQRQDSTSNTPLTLCSDSPVLDHFQLFEQETKSIFSSPIKTTAEGCPAVYCLPNFTLQAELDEGLCTTINGFMEKKFDGFENESSMDDVVDQFSEEDAETGSLSMDNDAKAGIVDEEETGFTVNITGSFFTQRAILDDEQMIQETPELLNEERSDNYVKISNWDFESKLKSKTVFIIQRNVARHVIEKKPKKEKKEKKLQSLEKKKKLKKEKTESDKETNKENEAPVTVEKVKRKYTKHKKLAKEGQEAVEGMDIEDKKKKKADKEEKIKLKIKKIKDTDEKKANKKKEKEKAKAEKSSVKTD